LNCFGGCVPLHRLQFQFSDSVIQTLLDKKLVQVQNTGRSFLLEIAEDF
jgi:chromosome segregation and condensation protein ScpB